VVAKLEGGGSSFVEGRGGGEEELEEKEMEKSKEKEKEWRGRRWSRSWYLWTNFTNKILVTGDYRRTWECKSAKDVATKTFKLSCKS